MLLAVCFLFVAALLFAASRLFGMDAWSKLDMTRITDVDQSVLLYDRDGCEITVLHDTEDRIWVPIEGIPAHVRNAFIAAEDARFYEHFGVDIIRIFGAAWADLKAGAYVQGASTISQQLVKLSHLTSKKEMSRKLEEAVLAYQLERRCEKDEILEMYLNYVYFGGGYYGVEAAARGYFGVHAGELTVAQSALLAGILKSPSRFAPHLKPEASVGRRNVILELMENYGYLSAEACALACAEPLTLVHGTRPEKRGAYVDLALSHACELLGMEMDDVLASGFRIETAMDAELQTLCETMVGDNTYFPDTAENGLETAMVVVDVKSGGVAALIGGRSESGALSFNRATMIRRQPGSVIKPILVYAPALQAGYTAATMLMDDQVDFDGYRPTNASGRYLGWVTMREAVTKSLNIPAVSVMAQIGVEKSKAFASRFGIEFDTRDRNLALALGGFTYGVSPWQIANAYAAFARGGSYQDTAVVMRITDRDGKVLYEYKPEPKRVMSEPNAYVLTSMLESVARTGTGRLLSGLDIDVAGKTGTTGEVLGNRDLWMAAYNPDYAAAVWMGYDENLSGRLLPEDATGGTYPAKLIRRLFAALYEDGYAPSFVMPVGVREYRIDSYTLDKEHTAVLANALTPEQSSYSEVFVVGTEPDSVTDYWNVPVPPSDLSAVLSEAVVQVAFTAPSRYMLYRLYREDAQGRSVMLAELSGESGRITYKDDFMPSAANKHSYYVIPVHPQLEIGGQRVTGAASPRAWLSDD